MDPHIEYIKLYNVSRSIRSVRLLYSVYKLYLHCPPATYLTARYQFIIIVQWWYTCRNETCSFFFRNIKNTWNATISTNYSICYIYTVLLEVLGWYLCSCWGHLICW